MLLCVPVHTIPTRCLKRQMPTHRQHGARPSFFTHHLSLISIAVVSGRGAAAPPRRPLKRQTQANRNPCRLSLRLCGARCDVSAAVICCGLKCGPLFRHLHTHIAPCIGHSRIYLASDACMPTLRLIVLCSSVSLSSVCNVSVFHRRHHRYYTRCGRTVVPSSLLAAENPAKIQPTT